MLASEFIANTKDKAFVWGESDCAIWVADYVLSATGYDPGACARGIYDSRMGCRRFIIINGGLVNLWRKCMGRKGESECSNGVGIIKARGQLIGAIIVNGMAAMKAEKGFYATTEYELIEGWEL